MKKRIFRASWSNYAVFLGVPIFIITLGVLAFSKIIFSATEVFFFFLGPFFAIIVALLVLLNARLEFFEDKIQIKRFLISRLRVENVSINKDSIAYGILSNNYRVFKKFKKQQNY